jgi:hypothetical protein
MVTVIIIVTITYDAQVGTCINDFTYEVRTCALFIYTTHQGFITYTIHTSSYTKCDTPMHIVDISSSMFSISKIRIEASKICSML